MELGISTYTYGWAIGVPGNEPVAPMDEQRLLDKAVEYGLSLVQFGDNLPVHTLPEERLITLEKRLQDEELTIELGARGLTPDHLERYIDLCVRFKASILRFVIDQSCYEPTIDEVVALLRDATPLLYRHGITLGLENHDRLTAWEFAEIIDRVGSTSVGICLDSVNSMGAGEGLVEVVHTLAPYTVNLHLKDFGIKRLQHLMGFQIDGRPAGEGMLNIPWLIEQIEPYGRCRTAILEQWVVPGHDLSQTIAKEEQWASASIQYLKYSGLFSFKTGQMVSPITPKPIS